MKRRAFLITAAVFLIALSVAVFVGCYDFDEDMNTYVVHFDSNGGEACADVTMSTTADFDVSKLPVPTREGYYFVGWYDTNYPNSLDDVIDYHYGNFDITLVAAWSSEPLRENFKYTIENNEITVTGIGYQATDIVIPAELFGLPVTKINENAFKGTYLTSISLPGTIKEVSAEMFKNCDYLESVTLGEGITSIGDNTFNGCKKLKSIVIPSTVTSIGVAAFSDCSNLQSVTLPEGLTEIRDSLFNSCSLTYIDIPSTVTSIGDRAFYNSNLVGINLPAGLKSIGNYAFV